MKAVTVAHVIYGLKRGGAERLLVPVARHAGSSRYRFIFIALTCAGPVENELRQCGADIRILRRDGKFTIFDLGRLIRLLKKEKVEIIHSHLVNADLWAGIAARCLGIKHISTLHGIEFRPIGILKQRLGMLLPDKIIAVSDYVAGVCIEQFKVKTEKVVMIYNGIDFERFQVKVDTRSKKEELGIRDEVIVLATFGRLAPEKGHRYLIEAAAQVRGVFKNIVVLIIGEGEIKKRLMQQASRLGIEKEIKFLGERQDIPELLSITDIVILPSLYEGFPLAALEAMAADKPIIATSVGGLPELITDKQDGILVEPKSSSSLAESILRLIKDKDFARQLVLRAKGKIKNRFNQEKMLSRITALYDEVLN